MAAVMAHERAAKAMLDQPGRALLALKTMPAGTAQSERRIAAPVEKQQRLFAALQSLVDGGGEARRNPFAPFWRPCPHVDGAENGERAPAIAIIQPHMAIAAQLRIDAALDRGRGGRQNAGRPLKARAHHRHVAGVIGDAVFLLVGALVFLIDDDHAQIIERQKQRRAGARHHARLARGRRSPESRPLARTDA